MCRRYIANKFNSGVGKFLKPLPRTNNGEEGLTPTSTSCVPLGLMGVGF